MAIDAADTGHRCCGAGELEKETDIPTSSMGTGNKLHPERCLRSIDLSKQGKICCAR